MKNIIVQTVDGETVEQVYSIKELPLLYYLINCKESERRGVTYYELPAAFDIETTNIYKRNPDGTIDSSVRPFAFMYHWQFCLVDRVVFGRTWESFIELLDRLRSGMNLDNKHRLVIWVHNLSFETAFMLPFLHLIEGSFWREERKPFRLVVDGGIEFRCSYALSNMSLEKLGEHEGIKYRKNDGEAFDYDLIRYPDTGLTELEESYCYCDVRGLCEIISNYLKRDTLASIPMTSTGFIRREARAAMSKNKNNRRIFTDSQLNEKTYTLLKSAFRGGDTHGNAVYANEVVTNCYSYDISSSYPAALCLESDYPIGRFTKISAKRFISGKTRAAFAHILTLTLKNPRYVGKCGNPYISLSKCDRIKYAEDESGNIITPVIDNGRIVQFFGFISIPVTDVDYDIIMSEYTAASVWVSDVYAAGKGKLPEELRRYICDRFRKKTELKGVESKAYEYGKEKAKINAIYGMMVTAIDSENIKWNPVNMSYDVSVDPLSDQLQKYYKSRNSFLAYQWGVFCTAFARRKLRTMLRKVGPDYVYCDTDSIKFINAKHIDDFEEENKKLRDQAIAGGAFATDRKGVIHYMGVWEYEGVYDEFKHLGAKRYIVKTDGSYYTTIAGVSKKRGREHFNRVGIDRFRDGETIENAGHLVAYYNDDPVHTVTINGRSFTSASNVALVDDTYTLGVTDEYFSVMETAKANACNITYT